MSLIDPFRKQISFFIAWCRGKMKNGFFGDTGFEDQKGSIPGILVGIKKKFLLKRQII